MVNGKNIIPKACAVCGIPVGFPGVKLDEQDICNLCKGFPEKERLEIDKKRYQDRCQELFNRERGHHRYDALMCYSGGKDSTYTMGLLKGKYGLNVLAMTLDNGFVSPQAVENIKNVVETLGVDHILNKPRFDLLADIFRHCASNDIFPAKTLERASTICTVCMAFTKFAALRMAIEEDIPFIIYGWSPGQAPLASSIMKNNPSLVRAMQGSVVNPLARVFGDEIKNYFLEESHFSMGERFPYNVHPMAFLSYSEGQIYDVISHYGWKSPRDVDVNSTNCLLNSLANSVHRTRFGINPYTFELAGLVRAGCMDKEEALRRLEQPEDPRVISQVAMKLGLIKR